MRKTTNRFTFKIEIDGQLVKESILNTIVIGAIVGKTASGWQFVHWCASPYEIDFRFMRAIESYLYTEVRFHPITSGRPGRFILPNGLEIHDRSRAYHRSIVLGRPCYHTVPRGVHTCALLVEHGNEWAVMRYASHPDVALRGFHALPPTITQKYAVVAVMLAADPVRVLAQRGVETFEQKFSTGTYHGTRTPGGCTVRHRDSLASIPLHAFTLWHGGHSKGLVGLPLEPMDPPTPVPLDGPAS